MPTYSYRCTECGTAFDIQQAFSDDSLTECPQIIDGRACGGKLRKLFSAVGISFNGSGFYRNDSRAGETKSRDRSGSENSDGTKSDAAKPDGSKAEGSKSEGAKSEGVKKDAVPASTGTGSGTGDSRSGSAKSAKTPATTSTT